MENYQDIQNIIDLLDSKMDSGTGRINLQVEESVAEGQVQERYHHGRCDVGSVWANGTLKNLGCD